MKPGYWVYSCCGEERGRYRFRTVEEFAFYAQVGWDWVHEPCMADSVHDAQVEHDR